MNKSHTFNIQVIFFIIFLNKVNVIFTLLSIRQKCEGVYVQSLCLWVESWCLRAEGVLSLFKPTSVPQAARRLTSLEFPLSLVYINDRASRQVQFIQKNLSKKGNTARRTSSMVRYETTLVDMEAGVGGVYQTTVAPVPVKSSRSWIWKTLAAVAFISLCVVAALFFSWHVMVRMKLHCGMIIGIMKHY